MQITIVGAGRGIGYAVAEYFGQKGYKIGLISRSEDKLQRMVEDLQAKGVVSMYAVADATDSVQLLDAYSSIFDAFNYPAMVLFNAFEFSKRKVFENSWENIASAMSTNVVAAYNLAKEILPQYIIENRGKLFFTGGGLADNPLPDFLALGMSKAALRNMVFALAKVVENTNVHVATLTINGFISEIDKKYNPKAIAEQYWNLFSDKVGEYRIEVKY